MGLNTLTLQKYQTFLIRRKTEIETLESQLQKFEEKIEILDKSITDHGSARDIVSRVGMLAQEEIKTVMEELMTEALQAVFGAEYSFEMDDHIARNKPETTMYVVVNGRRHSLKGELGGGVVDLVAFCLRVIIWAITSPRTSNVLVLDEPLKFVDKLRLEQVGIMVKKLSEMFEIQFIIITHEEQLINCADTAYLVVKEGNTSCVTKIV